jgi:hypothetical protein
MEPGSGALADIPHEGNFPGPPSVMGVNLILTSSLLPIHQIIEYHDPVHFAPKPFFNLPDFVPFGLEPSMCREASFRCRIIRIRIVEVKLRLHETTVLARPATRTMVRSIAAATSELPQYYQTVLASKDNI